MTKHRGTASERPDQISKGSSPPKLAFTINEFCRSSGIGRTRTYELIAAGKLKTVKLGRSRLIPADAANEFIASLAKEAA